MELNKNSFSARLYRWFYNTDLLPTSLCPYFWKLIVAYVLAAPIIVLTLPYELMAWPNRGEIPRDENLVVRITGSLILYHLMFLAMCMSAALVLFFYSFEKTSTLQFVYEVGGLLWLLLLGILLYEGGVKLASKIKHNRKKDDLHYVESKPNLFVEFIKAKYKKYCPKIDWK